MITPPQHPRMRIRDDGSIFLIMRSDVPAPSSYIGIIAGVVIGAAVVLLVAFAIVKCFIAWLHNYRHAKEARTKALTDQKAWYASTRPVVRQPSTPHLLDAYTGAPHIQREEETFGTDLEKNVINDVPRQLTPMDSQVTEKLPASCDLGMQELSGRDSASTATTHVSIGVAVPVKIPAPSSPTEVYCSRRV